jgi:hypothetical protein
MLAGLVLVDDSRDEKELSYFPVANLPSTPSARFASLFTKRRRWSLEAITPYIMYVSCDARWLNVCGSYRDLVEPGGNCEKLLLRHARLSEQGGTRFYCAR